MPPPGLCQGNCGKGCGSSHGSRYTSLRKQVPSRGGWHHTGRGAGRQLWNRGASGSQWKVCRMPGHCGYGEGRREACGSGNEAAGDRDRHADRRRGGNSPRGCG